MPGASVCFNCESRRIPCVSQSGDGARLPLRRCPESDSPRNSSTVVPQAQGVVENSVADQRAPFLAVLDLSGVSPPCWHAVVVRSADLTSRRSSPNLTRQQVIIGHLLVFPADRLSRHPHPARGKGLYARHYVQDYRPTTPS